MPHLSLENTNFYYEIHGKGHPLVLIAGYTCDHTAWLPIIDKLAQHFKVLIFDSRGVGKTEEKRKVPLSAELLADDAFRLSQALGFEKASFIGHSMGGTIAQTIGAKYSNSIEKLGIFNSTSKWRQAMLTAMQNHIYMRRNDVSLDIIFHYFLSWIFGEKLLHNSQDIQELKKLFLENPYLQSLEDQERQFKVLQNFDGRSLLKNIKVPTLVLAGKQDLLSLQYEGQHLASQIPKATYAEIDGAHGLMIEHPEEVLAVMRNFF